MKTLKQFFVYACDMPEADKALHSATGMLVVTFISLFCNAFGLHWFYSGLIAWFFLVVIAFGKEFWDKHRYGVFDIRDAIATINPLVYFYFLYRNLTRAF